MIRFKDDEGKSLELVFSHRVENAALVYRSETLALMRKKYRIKPDTKVYVTYVYLYNADIKPKVLLDSAKTICSVADHYDREVGRRKAITKLLNRTYISSIYELPKRYYPKGFRALIWRAYLSRTSHNTQNFVKRNVTKLWKILTTIKPITGDAVA